MATCTKCGEREAGKQRWCSRCRKGRTPGGEQEGERSRGENATLSVDPAYAGFNVSVDRVPESNSVRRRKAIQKGECPHCAVLLAEVARLRLLVPEIEMLRLDVGRLKGELAEARKGVWPVKEPVYEGRIGKNCGGPGRCGKVGCAHP